MEGEKIDNSNKELITLVIIGIIAVAIFFVIITQMTAKPRTTQQAQTSAVTQLFDKITYEGAIEFEMDCSVSGIISEKKHCLVRGDGPTGWTVGAVDYDSLSQIFGFLNESDTGATTAVLNGTEKHYDASSGFEPAAGQMLLKASDFSNAVIATAETAVDPKLRITASVEPSMLNNDNIWLVSFGSPANPEAKIFVSFDGTEVLKN